MITQAAKRGLSSISRLGLFEVRADKYGGFKPWITSSSYYVNLPIGDFENFALQVNNPDAVTSALAKDCNRMASAAFETIAQVRKGTHLPRHRGWSVIQCYYAAFFAAHAIMRMFGTSCISLTSSYTKPIKSIATAMGYSNVLNIDDGFYRVKFDPEFVNLSFLKYRDSHKDTWKVFLNTMNSINEDLDNPSISTKVQTELFELLEAIKSIIAPARFLGGNWLSTIRNRVNYQLDLGAWHPYKDASNHKLDLNRIFGNWAQDEPEINISKPSELDISILCCLKIVKLLKLIIEANVERTGNPNRIFIGGCQNVLNQIAV